MAEDVKAALPMDEPVEKPAAVKAAPPPKAAPKAEYKVKAEKAKPWEDPKLSKQTRAEMQAGAERLARR